MCNDNQSHSTVDNCEATVMRPASYFFFKSRI